MTQRNHFFENSQSYSFSGEFSNFIKDSFSATIIYFLHQINNLLTPTSFGMLCQENICLIKLIKGSQMRGWWVIAPMILTLHACVLIV